MIYSPIIFTNAAAANTAAHIAQNDEITTKQYIGGSCFVVLLVFAWMNLFCWSLFNGRPKLAILIVASPFLLGILYSLI